MSENGQTMLRATRPRRVATLCGILLSPTLAAVLLSTGSCTKDDPEIPLVASIAQGYVGVAVCQTCHGIYKPAVFFPTYYDDWLANGHGQIGDTVPSDASIVGDSDSNGTHDFKDGLDLNTSPDWTQYTFAGSALGDFAPVLGHDVGTDTPYMVIAGRQFNVVKLTGGSRNKQAYLTPIGNSLYVLPALYRKDTQQWVPFMTERWYLWSDDNSDGVLNTTEQVTGVLYSTAGETPVSQGTTRDSWESYCAGCHVTGLTSVDVNIDDEVSVTYLEEGVSCEACHGPGRVHALTLGGRGLPGRAIVNPNNVPIDRYNEICSSCHHRGWSKGLVGGSPVHYPWHPAGRGFLPGEVLNYSFYIDKEPPQWEPTISTQRDVLHELQYWHLHKINDVVYGTYSFHCHDCHRGHDTTNLALIRMTINTPNSGPRPVVFTVKSGPVGTPGLMGDPTDPNYTDVCEVCHTQTQYYRNDPSSPILDHYPGWLCSRCHVRKKGANCLLCHFV